MLQVSLNSVLWYLQPSPQEVSGDATGFWFWVILHSFQNLINCHSFSFLTPRHSSLFCLYLMLVQWLWSSLVFFILFMAFHGFFIKKLSGLWVFHYNNKYSLYHMCHVVSYLTYPDVNIRKNVWSHSQMSSGFSKINNKKNCSCLNAFGGNCIFNRLL